KCLAGVGHLLIEFGKHRLSQGHKCLLCVMWIRGGPIVGEQKANVKPLSLPPRLSPALLVARFPWQVTSIPRAARGLAQGGLTAPPETQIRQMAQFPSAREIRQPHSPSR